VLNTQTILIEDPVVQIGLSNIFDDQDVGFILTSNTASGRSNIAIGYIPINSLNHGGLTDEFIIARTTEDSSSVPEHLLVDETQYINVHVYGNVIANGSFYAGGELVATQSYVTGLGYQTSTDVSTYVTGLGYQTSTDVSTYVTGLGYQTSTDVSTYVTGLGYQTSTDVTNAISAATIDQIQVSNINVNGTTSNILGYNGSGIVDTGVDWSTIGGGSNVFPTTIQANDPNVSLTAAGKISADTIDVREVLTTNLICAFGNIADFSSTTIASDILNTNEAHVADLYVAGENVQFFGSTVNMDGNLFANTVTTGDVTTGTLETSGDVTIGGKLYLTGIDRETTASNILGYNPLTNEVFDTEIPSGSTSSNLQAVTTNGATTNKTLVLTNATGLQASGNISVTGTVSAQNIVGNTITGVQSGAINVLNTNELHVADMYAVGQNINFYGPTVTMKGNLTSQNITTGVLTANTMTGNIVAPVALIDATLTKSLDVSGPATFNGVTTVSVLKFTPGGIDPALTAPTVSATVSGGVIQLNANGAVYGSNTLTSPGTITGFNVSNLNEGSHVYEYVKNVTIVALSDANTYLSKVTGSGIHVMFHVFKVGGTVFIDATKVNSV
jgi:hypothetical protein